MKWLILLLILKQAFAQTDCSDGTVRDACGWCGGDNSSCADLCGIPNGNNSCVDCDGTPHGTAVVDACGHCGGDNSSCADLCGVPNGNNDCVDCNGTAFGTAVRDACGWCGGDGSTCCDGNPPCSAVGTAECIGGDSFFQCECKSTHEGALCATRKNCDTNDSVAYINNQCCDCFL